MILPGPLIGFAAVPALLGSAQPVVGLGPAGWAAGLSAAAVVNVTLARGLIRRSSATREPEPLELGPANRVTLARAVLVSAVAAFVTDSTGPAQAAIPVALTSAVALSLDGLDGWVARRTGTASALGARFDMEVDAFLILVLSVAVARQVGWWVLALGAWRYVRWAAAGLAPWLRREVAARRWRKVVAASQGVVLVAAAAQAFPRTVSTVALAASLALLSVSFGTEIASLWQQRADAARPSTIDAAAEPAADAAPQPAAARAVGAGVSPHRP